jgi:CheY-specific phosphatase CheX
MKSVKDKIVYFTYEGKVDERNNKLLLQEIKEMREDINSRKLTGLFISLQNITYDLISLKELVKSLHNMTKTIDAPICLGEFTTLIYKILKKETKETYIKLFKTFGLAKLFLNTKSFKKQLKVLMFDDGEDEKELDKQASMLTRYEHNILYTKDIEEFRTKILDPHVDFAVNQTKINLTKKKKDTAKKAFLLSKKLVSNLAVFTDTAVDNLETMTGLKATKTSHTIGLFDQSIKNSIISAIMQFKGDIEGQFVLVFPKDVALISIEAMLGEELKQDDIEGISDGIGEFCNIIMGGTKTALSKKDVKVLFDLPRTYTTINSTTSALPQNNGIWINMELESKPFYMYITK